MAKPILVGLILTTLCMVFEANGFVHLTRSLSNPLSNSNNYNDSQPNNNMPQYESKNPFEKSFFEQSIIPELSNLKYIHDTPSDKKPLLKNTLYNPSNPGLFVKRNFVFPNGRGTIAQYSNTWDLANNDTPSFNTRINPMNDNKIYSPSNPGSFVKRDFVIPNGRGTITQYSNTWDLANKDTPSFDSMKNVSLKKMQSIPFQNIVISEILQQIKSMAETQKKDNYLSKIQENSGSTINEKLVDPNDSADNVFNSNYNKKQEPQQKLYTNNKSTNHQKINKKPKNTNSEESNDLRKKQINEIRNQVLKQSNYYRQKHNLPKLSIDDQLNSVAQDWAEHLGSIGTMQHRPNNKYGENIYMGSGSAENLGDNVVNAWYNEILDYQLNKNENYISQHSGIHHMTQLLWKSSSKLGVGVSQDARGMYYVVANYDPAGNFMGRFMQNLPKITQADIDEARKNAS